MSPAALDTATSQPAKSAADPATKAAAKARKEKERIKENRRRKRQARAKAAQESKAPSHTKSNEGLRLAPVRGAERRTWT